MPRPNLTDQFNTPLTESQELIFKDWLKKNGREEDLFDYDMRGAWKEGINQGDNGHFTDKFKKPNHPTFSNESQYHSNDLMGGEWGENDSFTPSEHNLKNMSKKELEQYFKEVEPNSKLIFKEKSRLQKLYKDTN